MSVIVGKDFGGVNVKWVIISIIIVIVIAVIIVLVHRIQACY